MNVIGGGARVTAQQFPPILAGAAELHVVILLFLASSAPGHQLRAVPIVALLFEIFKVLLLCLPLNPFLLLQGKH